MARTYKLNDPLGPGLTLMVHNDKDCIFCDHSNVFWDYTNGPYMFICDMNRSECSEAKTPEDHTCPMFEETKGETE